MSINEIISRYNSAKEAEATAKKESAAMKALIIEFAKDAETFTTDEYTVIIKTSSSTRLDTSALYKDFPDIKNTYGKTTTSISVDVAKNEATTEKKTA